MSSNSGRPNDLDPRLDMRGVETQNQTMTLADETLCLGVEVSAQSGSAASITTVSSGIATVTGLTGMTQADVGNILYITGADSAGNNGAFLISALNSATSVDVVNASAVASDANNGSIVWSEREPYAIEDNVNYTSTDRRLIKGTTNFYDAIPVYQRPTAIGTDVDANLTNIAGKTTDAQGFILPDGYRGASVTTGDGYILITSVGNLKHSDAVNKQGVPCFDIAPYTGDWNACYVLVSDPADDNQIQAANGETIFGITRAGTSSTSPNSVEIEFYTVAHGADISTGTPFTWTGAEPTSIDVTIGEFERLDLMDEYSFRRLTILGIESDSDLRNDVDNLQVVIGVGDNDTDLSTQLTNTTDFYAFSDLPDATPSVVEALNTLNAQVGDRDYTGTVLTDGETVTASLQALASAIGSSSVTRVIERIAAQINAYTPHTLPGGNTYTLDGTDNGANMFVYVRGLLKDPGAVSDGNNYDETSTTSVTFYQKIRKDDHINYMILQ